MIDMETRRQKIAKIIADNVHHSAQLNATVIHGAIDEIEKLIDEELSRLREREKELNEKIKEHFEAEVRLAKRIGEEIERVKLLREERKELVEALRETLPLCKDKSIHEYNYGSYDAYQKYDAIVKKAESLLSKFEAPNV